MSLRNVGVVYGSVPALVDVDLDVEPGELVAVVGPNGCGKSTLLSLFGGLHGRRTGSVRLDGTDVSVLRPRDRAAAVGILVQQDEAPPPLTVAELVGLGTSTASGRLAPRSPDEQAVQRALSLTGVDGLHERSASTLSGGQLQRVLLARAVVHRPRLLVLDEPTNHLDPRHQFEVLELARTLGLTVLTALHTLDLAARYADRVLVLQGGRTACSGRPADVFTTTLLRDVFGVDGSLVSDPVDGRPRVIMRPLDERGGTSVPPG